MTWPMTKPTQLTEATVALVIATCLGLAAEDLTATEHLGNDLEADSLDVVEIWMALEEEFGVDMPDEEVEGLHTVGQITEYVKRKVRQS